MSSSNFSPSWLVLFFIFNWSSASPVVTSSETKTSFIEDLLSWRDLSVNPCDNFYKYACGSKLKEPPSGPVYFQNIMNTQAYETLSRTKALMDKPPSPVPTTFEKAIKAFNSCMNLDPSQSRSSILNKISSLGGWPIAEGSSWVSPGDTLDSLFPTMATMIRSRMTTGIFDVIVMPDPFNTARNLVQLFPPPGLMLPYTTDDAHKTQLVRTINTYLRLVYGSISFDTNEILKVIDFNNNLWQILFELPDTERIKDSYTTTTLKEAVTSTQINFISYLNELFRDIRVFSASDEVVLIQSPYFVRLGQILQQTLPRTIVNFEMISTIFPAIQDSGISLGKGSRDSLFDLPGPSFELPRPKGSQPKRIIHPDWLKTVNGNLDQKNVACLQRADNWFSYAIAKFYHDNYFSKMERLRAKETAREIIKVFANRLEEIDWLDDSSKDVAKLKLKFLKETYLYGSWVDNLQLLEKFYQTFEVSSIYMDNFWSANTFMRETNFRLLGDSVLPLNDSINFDISPMEVNAFYFPPENSITILEGIVQPPVFDDDRLQLFNYAMLGTIIGHEITHGFDINGQQYGEHGNLREWMNEEVLKTFQSKASCFVKQYDAYALTQEDFPAFPGFYFKIDGARTLGENMADNGGIQQAFWAYRQWVNESGVDETLPPTLQDFTPEQVFFLTYAHLWCNKYYGFQSELNVLQMDVHSPGKFRVIGTLSNFDEFSRAFHCSPGTAMNRGSDACRVW